MILGVVREAARRRSSPCLETAARQPARRGHRRPRRPQTLLEHRQALKIAPAQTLLMTNTLRGLDAIVARGVITPAERTAMVNVARIVLVSVF